MAFCEFSSEVVSKNFVTLDNIFISEFMPMAQENCVKVYLYGLYLCSTSRDNNLDSFSKVMNLSKEDIISIYYYWQEEGLVQVLNIDPIQVRYLPVKNAVSKIRKYNVDKYTSFNISCQELLTSKMLTPRDLEEFYYLIEGLQMEKDAVLRLIDYCVKLKGESVSVNYITTVGKNWAHDGVRSVSDVDDRILDQERISGDIVLVLKAIGIRRQANVDEFKLYLTWTKDMEIDKDIIVKIAKSSKSKTFARLDDYVKKCYSLKLESVKEVDDYFASREKMFMLAKNVVKNLGLYYSDLTEVIDTYISNWLQLGFEEEAILKLSRFAFKSSIRTLESFDNQVNNMFKLGLLTSSSIDNYMANIVKNDGVICQILEKLGIERKVNSIDRTFYKTWIYDWGMSKELIDFAVTSSVGRYMPMQYVNKILSEYHINKIGSIDDAKKFTPVAGSLPKTTGKEVKKTEYTKQELESLFDDIQEVEI